MSLKFNEIILVVLFICSFAGFAQTPNKDKKPNSITVTQVLEYPKDKDKMDIERCRWKLYNGYKEYTYIDGNKVIKTITDSHNSYANRLSCVINTLPEPKPSKPISPIKQSIPNEMNSDYRVVNLDYKYKVIPVETWNNHVNPLAHARSDLNIYRNNVDLAPTGQVDGGIQKGVGPQKQIVSQYDLQVWMAKTPEQRKVEYENNKKLLLDQASTEILKDRNQNKDFEAQIEKMANEEPAPLGVSQKVADAPFQAINKLLIKDDFHEVVENLKVWQQEIEVLKGYERKVELAKYWETRLQKDFVHENGLLKVFENAKEYKINLSSKKGREASAFINHMLLVKTELEAAASYQLLTSKADFQEIENYNLSIERERYLKYIERFTKELLNWAGSPDGKINSRDFESIIQDHKAFAESLQASDDPVSVQVEKFLESQKLKNYASLNDNFVKESTPFGEYGKSSDPVTKAGYQELAEILRSDETQKSDPSNLNRLDRLTQKDLERAQEGIFFTPKDSEQGKALSSGLDLAAKSVALFNENSKYLSGSDRDNFRNDYQTLSRSLAEAHILADKLWVSDQNRAVMLLGQIKPIADFTYGFALGVGHGLKDTAYGVKDLVVLSGTVMKVVGSSVASSLKKVPELTLHDAEIALGNFFTGDHLSEMASTLGTSTVSAYHHVSGFIKHIAEESADTLINGTAKEKGEIVGRVAYEIGFFIFGGEIIKAGVGGAKAVGNTASLISGAAQKSLQYLAFERKAAQLAKLPGINGTQSLKLLNFAREYPSVAANVLKETSSLGAISELAGMSTKDAKFLGKLAANIDVANKLMSKEDLVSKAAIVSRESELVLKAIPKQSEKLHSLVVSHFEKSIQKLYEINLKTYYNKLGWHEALIQSNMRTAIDFYSSHPDFINNGVVNFEKISQHLIGIDFSKPVEIVSLEKGTRLVTWHADIAAIIEENKQLTEQVKKFINDNAPKHFTGGNYFTVQGYSPNQLGIASSVPIKIAIPGIDSRTYAKVPFWYELSEDTLVLKSRSNMILDTFTYEKMGPEMKKLAKVPHPFDSSKEAFDKLLPGIDFATGGGEQYLLDGRLMVPVK